MRRNARFATRYGTLLYRDLSLAAQRLGELARFEARKGSGPTDQERMNLPKQPDFTNSSGAVLHRVQDDLPLQLISGGKAVMQ
jgi:hypothetical protein